jgi:LPXTG-motif cell wall-anchored protein
MVEGTGMETVLIAMGAVVIVIIAVIVYFLLKRKRSVYTYAYKS